MDNNFAKGTAWAILPAHYKSLEEQYLSVCDNDNKQAITEFNEKIKKQELVVEDGVAQISISGAISNRQSFFSFLFGGATISSIERELTMAADDWRVKSVLLNIDSPGGTIGGVDDLATLVRNFSKPIVAYSGGMMCSAAYWIGSAADKIVISKTADVGSIGVLMVHEETSKLDKDIGIKATVLKSGKYKAIGNPYEPLSKDGKEAFQSELDYLYSIFVETVAKNKSTSIENVLNMADGKVFIGQQAKDIGLVDQIGTFKDAFNITLSAGASEVKYFLLTGKKRTTIMSETTLNSVKDLKDAFPDLAAAILKEGKESVDTAGIIKAENSRILELAKVHFGADGDKFENLVKSGVTLEQYQAMKDLQPEPESKEDMKAKILAELEKDHVGDPGTGDDNSPKDFTAAWQEIKSADKCSTQQAMSKAAKQYPDLYTKHASGKNN